jgi:hypothetical protein
MTGRTVGTGIGLALALGPAVAAGAEGFATRDLTQVAVDTAAFTSGAFVALPEPRKLMIACLECSRTAVVNLRLAEAPGETEENLRTGIMTLADMQAACAAATGVACLGVETAAVGPAVGWMTMTRSGADREIRTYELYLGGERLTIQAIAETREEADALGRTAFDLLAPQIVGAAN